jgi:nicotinate-nucleotide pyrophosphorylase (carboxylating)
MSPSALETVRRALAEDLGDGDVTSEAFIPSGCRATARIVARQRAVVAGTGAAAAVFNLVDADCEVSPLLADGAGVDPGGVVMEIRGPVRALLAGERTALNFLQRLSGVATLTRRFVDAVAGTGAAILDTRKTTPGLREFERAAVRAGGGTNHRSGLFDMVLAKDNHLAVTGDAAGLQRAVRNARGRHPGIRVEIEADTLDQVRLLCGLEGVDIILLDNMSTEQMREAVAIRGSAPVLLEASGGVNLATVHAIAETGVERISVGALTHSAPAVDFSLELATGV